MQDIREESLNESVKSEQSPRVVLWEIDLTVQGGERYFFCNELNEKGEPVTWQGRKYEAYPIDGSGFEMNGRGSSARPSLTVSNLFGLVTGMAEDLQSLVGATVVRRRVYARFLDAVNFVAGNPEADPEQELSDRWVVEQMSQLTAMTASFVLATPTETDGALFPVASCWRTPVCGITGEMNAGITVLRWRMSSTTPPRISVRTDAASACAGVRCAAWWLILAVSFPLTNFRSKSNDTDRISDSGACPAVCACGVVRLSGENAGGGAVYPLCEYLCRAGGVFSYCTGRLAAGRDAGGDCGTGPQSSRWAALAERG